MNYDLEERTAKFSENLIELCKKVLKNTITIPIIDQLIRSGTSIGANYVEATAVHQVKKILKTKFIFVLKKQKRQNTG